MYDIPNLDELLNDVTEKHLSENKEQKEYETSYKNVLWIDDRAANDASSSSPSDKLKWMKDFLANPESIMQIEQEDSFFEAVKKIINPSKYDLVIFDINLENCFDTIYDKDVQELEEIFSKYHIKFNYSDVSSNDGKKTAGIYLYLLLLSTGYPIERMLVYTGNGKKVFEDKANKMMSFIDLSNILKEKTEKLNIEYYFRKKEYLYYRIRRLVFQACEYWKANMEKEAKDIAFNKIYFPDAVENSVSVESFKEFLERTELLFPVVKPDNPEKVYYHAMQIISMVHEESAKIQKANGVCKPYHSMIRNFRNWSAHNRLEKTELDGEQFALLFCIALRTMFDEHQNSKLYSYEEVFDFNCIYEKTDEEGLPIEIDLQLSKNDLNKKFNEIFEELYKININNSDETNNSISTAMFLKGTLSHLIHQIPNNLRKYPIKNKYLFMNLWCVSEKIKLSITINKKENNLVQPFQVVHNWICPVNECQRICKLSQKKDSSEEYTSEAIFMRYCYRWI